GRQNRLPHAPEGCNRTVRDEHRPYARQPSPLSRPQPGEQPSMGTYRRYQHTLQARVVGDSDVLEVDLD
ncbi:hypothetical protein ACW7EJ_10885, partial [Acinetobacter soli]